MKDNRVRYTLAILLFTFLSALFAIGRGELHPVHFWNRIIADASFVLICFTLILGPATQLFPRLGPLLPLRRELGVVAAISAIVHVAVYMKAFNWNPLGFFFLSEAGEVVLKREVFAAANWVGFVGLVIILVLGLSSNDFSQKWLGKGWKFLQQGNYTLFVLVVLHTALFLYLVYTQRTGFMHPIFWWLSLITVGFQLTGYIRTVRLSDRRRALK